MEDKIYYSISEIAEMFDVNQSLIRFWEKEFPKHINPKRNKRGVRFFSKKDIDNIKVIYDLLKVQKYTIQGAKEELKNESKNINKKTTKIKKEKPTAINNDEDLNKTEKFLKYNHNAVYEKLDKIKRLTEKLLEK